MKNQLLHLICQQDDLAGTARAEDPGLSAAKEAAEAVPAEINFSSISSIVKEKRL